MRNNQDRLNAIQFENPENFAQEQQFLPRGVESVPMPSKGLFYPKSSILSQISTLEIKEMTTVEEDILASENNLKDGTALDKFAKSVLVNKSINPMDLLPCDFDALVIKARITGYGPDYPIHVTCNKCFNKFEYQLDANELLKSCPLTEEKITNGTFELYLQRIDTTLTLKILNRRDLENLEKLKKEKQNKKVPETNRSDRLVEMIVAVNGKTDFETKAKLITEVLKPMDTRYIYSKYSEVCPKLDTNCKIKCSNPECENINDVEVTITAKFFWPY